MLLRQGTRSIEDYVADFLELAHLTPFDEICLMIFFRGGLSEPLSSIMPLYEATWTLEKYSDIALQLSGSPFNVGVAEEENNCPVVTFTPKTCHKMAADPESHNRSAKPESALIVPAKPESALIVSAKPESAHRACQARICSHRACQARIWSCHVNHARLPGQDGHHACGCTSLASTDC